MVDSGATNTFLGPQAMKLVEQLSLSKRFSPTKVRTANSQFSQSSFELDVPFRLKDKTVSVTAREFPPLPYACLFGLDFLKAFDMQVDFSKPQWSFGSEPETKYSFETPEGEVASFVCNNLTVLTNSENDRLRQLLEAEIPPPPEKLTLTPLATHHIDVGNHRPIRQKFRRVPPRVYKAICDEVDKMLALGIIEESKSPWSNPIVMIRKPNNKFRFCLDLRELNNCSKKDRYPLPVLDSIFDQLRNARYITTIDLSQAYFQVELDEDSREYTAFAVPGKGFFQFRRLCFGLTGARRLFNALWTGYSRP